MRPDEFDVTKGNEWLAVTDDPDYAKLELAGIVEEAETAVRSVERGYSEMGSFMEGVAELIEGLPVVRDVKVESDAIVVIYDTTITWDVIEVLMFIAGFEYDSAYAHGHSEQTAKVAEIWRVDDEFWSEMD